MSERAPSAPSREPWRDVHGVWHCEAGKMRDEHVAALICTEVIVEEHRDGIDIRVRRRDAGQAPPFVIWRNDRTTFHRAGSVRRAMHYVRALRAEIQGTP